MCYNYTGHNDHIEPLTRGIASLQSSPATRMPESFFSSPNITLKFFRYSGTFFLLPSDPIAASWSSFHLPLVVHKTWKRPPELAETPWSVEMHPQSCKEPIILEIRSFTKVMLGMKIRVKLVHS